MRERLDPPPDARCSGAWPVPPQAGERWRWRVPLAGFPTWNQIIAAKRRLGRASSRDAAFRQDAYGAMKRKAQDEIHGLLKVAGVKAIKDAGFGWDWCSTVRRIDPDNLIGVRKFVEDALVAGGYIEDDAWEYVLTEITPGRFGWLWESFYRDPRLIGLERCMPNSSHGLLLTIEGTVVAQTEWDRRLVKVYRRQQANASRRSRKVNL